MKIMKFTKLSCLVLLLILALLLLSGCTKVKPQDQTDAKDNLDDSTNANLNNDLSNNLQSAAVQLDNNISAADPEKENPAEDFCFICPACQSTDIEVKQGRELNVREITAE